MRAYVLLPGFDIDSLEIVDRPTRALEANELRISTRAVSLNSRDLMIARAENRLAARGRPIIPASDASGEIVEVGPAVSRFAVGDRVTTSFFPKWIDGPATAEKIALIPGGNVDGVLAEELIVDEQAVVANPPHLDYHSAATLTCAGVTAWNALFGGHDPHWRGTVLLLGTGGVSIWALQLAVSAGLRTIITSSSDSKLERAKALGAHATINYRTQPKWHKEVMQITQGGGVDLVVEVGGGTTLKQSLIATKMGGSVAVVGGVSGYEVKFEPLDLIGGARLMRGVLVGSRAMHEQLNEVVTSAAIRPIIDRIYLFDQAPQAYAYLASGSHFGKIVIALPDRSH